MNSYSTENTTGSVSYFWAEFQLKPLKSLDLMVRLEKLISKHDRSSLQIVTSQPN